MINTLTASEVNVVSGGHYEVLNGTYTGFINAERNGVRGHYDMYRMPDGSMVGVWHPDTAGGGGGTNTN